MKYIYAIISMTFKYHTDMDFGVEAIQNDIGKQYNDSKKNIALYNKQNYKYSILLALHNSDKAEIQKIADSIYNDINYNEDDDEYIYLEMPITAKIIDESEFRTISLGWYDDADENDRVEYLKQLKKLLDNNKNNSIDTKFINKIEKLIIESHDNAPTGKKILNKINKLVGLEEFKQYMNELDSMKELLKTYNRKPSFPTQHFIFAANYGSGCSIALDLLNKYLREEELYYLGFNLAEKNDFVMTELTFNGMDSPNETVDMKFENVKNKISDSSTGVIGIHIEEWIDKLEDDLFTKLLNYCFDNRYDNNFVFIIPLVDEGTLGRIYKRINDIINVKAIRFKPYTDEQLIKIIKNELLELNFTCDSCVDTYLKYAINVERNRGRFSGIQSAKKIATQIARMKIHNVAVKHNETNPAVIDKIDFEGFLDSLYDNDISGYEELDAMIGLEDVKERIKEIVVSIKNQKRLKQLGMIEEAPCYHMMFTGNPGTGKTTVSRIIGKLFRENDLLGLGDLIEVNRFDLVGEFIGQTAIKTMAVCKNALGSVLFIDEAHMLADGSSGKNSADFGAESLGTLITEMENHRDEFIVIFAGYDKDMERLFEINSGLRDRIPHRIHFPNYTRQQLFEIFRLQVKDKYIVGEKLLNIVQNYFLSLPQSILDDEEFGNARFVRNLVERVRMKAYTRMHDSIIKNKRLELLDIDFESAILDNDFKEIQKVESKHLGFNM